MLITWSKLQDKCEQRAIATIKALRDRGLDFSIPTLSSLWKIDHQTEISVWFDGQLARGFSAPRFTVGYSVCLESDDKLWLHLSISKKAGKLPRTIPEYQEAKEICKMFYSDAFGGKQRWYVQYFPVQDEHVNIAEVLHFWHCLESNPIPDFRKFGFI